MPPKKKPQTEPVKITGSTEVSVMLPERVEAPELLAPVVKEYGLELADAKVDAHLRTFLPYVAEIVELEQELTDLLTGEITPELSDKAKELRGKYRTIRTSSDATKKAEKEDFVKEGRFLDKVNNTITEAAKLKEAKCLEIENHLENLENARLSELKADRKAKLEALDYETDFLDLTSMTEETFNRLVSKAEQAKLGADALRKQREEEESSQRGAAARFKARVDGLKDMGLIYDEATRNFSGDNGRIDTDVVEFFSDAEYNKHFEPIFKRYTEAKKAKDDAQKATERLNNRMASVSSLGLLYNTSAERYEGYDQSITLYDLKTLDPQAFKDTTDLIRGNVNDAKQKASAAQEAADKATKALQDAENKRIAKQNEANEAARLLALAPDKEKFKAYYVRVKAIFADLPALESKEGKKVLERIKEIGGKTLTGLQGEATKLI